MHPNQMSQEQKANEFEGWFRFFAQAGLMPKFSDDPQALILLPLALSQGAAEVTTCRKLGRELLLYADRREAELGPLGPVTTTTTAPIPPREIPYAPAGEDRLDRLEAAVMKLASALPAAEPPPYQYTIPTPGEHAVAPVAPR